MEYPSDVMGLIFDAIDIRKQMNVLGVTISTFLLLSDERVSEQEKKFAREMLRIYRQLLYFGKIEKIYFQTGNLRNKASIVLLQIRIVVKKESVLDLG